MMQMINLRFKTILCLTQAHKTCFDDPALEIVLRNIF